MKTYWRILTYLSPYKWKIVLHALMVIISIIFLAVSISLLQPIVNLIFSEKSLLNTANLKVFSIDFMQYFNNWLNGIIIEYGKQTALLCALTVIVICNLTGNIFKFLASYFITFARTKLIEDVRRETFSKISGLQIAYFEGERKGDIMTRLSSDLTQIENLIVISLESIIRDPLTIIAFIALMISSSLKLTLFIFILLPISAVVISAIARSLRKDSHITQNFLSSIMSVVDEFTSGIRVVKAFNGEKYVKNIFNDYNKQYSRYSRKVQNKQNMIQPVSESLGVLTMGLFIWLGGQLVFKGNIQAASIITFVIFFQQIMKPAKNITQAYSNIMRGVASADRLFELMDANVTIKDLDNAIPIGEFKDEISFNKVNFAYNHEYVLRNINITIPKGKIYAVVGPSGSGKTTFAELILRFYEVREGSISIDGKDIRNIKQSDLRNKIAIVTQEPILFNDTIFNNIRFGLDDVKEEDVIAAAKAANAHDFIMDTEEGYQTNIGDRGGLLSGGQRQRMSIARAILRNPSILILDEATSSLDTNSEQIVQEALNSLMKNRTSIVIAHRLSTIQNADKIIVMDKGEIVQFGSHSELIGKEGMYQHLYRLQQLASN
jgi:ATP-binding cassette, subfamily B, bacterial MsbA